MNEEQRHLLATIEAAIPAGHMPTYALGRRYAYCAAEALLGEAYDPTDAINLGDVFLGGLIDINDADELRDFIAGVASGLERVVAARCHV